MVYGHSTALIHTGEAHLAAGGLDEARRYAGQALDLASRQGARGDEARARHLLGEIASRGEPSESEQALESYAAALVLAEELGMAPLQARCHLGLGGVRQRVGQDEDGARRAGPRRGDAAGHADATLAAKVKLGHLERSSHSPEQRLGPPRMSGKRAEAASPIEDITLIASIHPTHIEPAVEAVPPPMGPSRRSRSPLELARGEGSSCEAAPEGSRRGVLSVR